MNPRANVLPFLAVLLLPELMFAQRGDIVIPTGAEIAIPSGAQLCADRYYANNPVYGTLTYGNDPARICGAVVPVEFLSLSANYHDGAVKVAWRTASESNCAGYEVLRSTDQSYWNPVGYVPGHGTTSAEYAYGYDDALPPALMHQRSLFYRLKQIDHDGSSEYSPAVEVAIDGRERALSLEAAYPNPASDKITVRYSLPTMASARITVYSLTGQVMASFDGAELSGCGEHILSVDIVPFPPGGYLVELSADDTRLVRQVVVRR